LLKKVNELLMAIGGGSVRMTVQLLFSVQAVCLLKTVPGGLPARPVIERLAVMTLEVAAALSFR